MRKERKKIYFERNFEKKMTKGDMRGLVNNVVYLVYYINHCYCSLIFCFNTYCLVMYFTSSIGRCMGNIYIYEKFVGKINTFLRKEKKTKPVKETGDTVLGRKKKR